METIFNIQIRPEIIKLAESILDAEEINAANGLLDLLVKSKKDGQHAIGHLQELVGTKPKRPLYYLNHAITGLPEHTRNVVRYAGDYIDQLIKHCSYDKGDFLIFRFRGLHKSLGINLKKLKKLLPEKLLTNLTVFNEIIYVPAKHEWNVPRDRSHLFTAKEAVFVCFMIKKLAAQIIPLSAEAQMYDENKKYNYNYDSSQH